MDNLKEEVKDVKCKQKIPRNELRSNILICRPGYLVLSLIDKGDLPHSDETHQPHLLRVAKPKKKNTKEIRKFII